MLFWLMRVSLFIRTLAGRIPGKGRDFAGYSSQWSSTATIAAESAPARRGLNHEERRLDQFTSKRTACLLQGLSDRLSDFYSQQGPEPEPTLRWRNCEYSRK